MQITFMGEVYRVKFWDGETLPDGDLTVDTETYNIAGPDDTPDLVLLQVLHGNTVWLADWVNGAGLVEQFHDHRCVMHNAPFDVDVLQKQWGWNFHKQVDDRLLYDTGVLFRLRDLFHSGKVGSWNLQYAAKVLLKEDLSKSDDVRMGWTRENRCWEWPEERLVYGSLDVIATYQCFKAMEWILKEPNELSHQGSLMGEIALNRITKRGIGFDQAEKANFLVEVDKHINSALARLASVGYVPGMNKVQTHEQKLLAEMEEDLGIMLPRAPSSTPSKIRRSTKREDLEEYADSNVFVGALLEYKEYKKLRDFVVKLETDRVYPRYTGILRTGRTSCSNPNIQQLPRRPGVRECFVPRPGHSFVIVDYAMLEIVTLAQTTYTMYGYSQMREVLNQGIDVHKWAATVILERESLDAVTKDDRQGMKAVNFGKPGGLGAKKLKLYAKKTYNVEWTVEECQDKIDRWVRAFPEMEQWLVDTIPDQFDWSQCPMEEEFRVAVTTRILRGNYKSNTGKPYSKEWLQWVFNNVIKVKCPWIEEYDPIKHFGLVWSEDTWTTTGRKRARASYNASRNTRFQGLGADVAKLALWMLDRAGVPVVAMIHDEVICEVPTEQAEFYLKEVERIMLEAEAVICPDVKGGAEGKICQRWTK